ncbi:FAD-dependent oxidoreductase [Polaribacter dokdonensis]|uniref:Flavin containing amine oxidoreductase n=1 Tax=Polaribacter dokdonensis DSW-5 TaxID=1300348 RepID=A0A0M9CFE1_9FLAO|nr:FAD-dependent oxidoreductase [Polaribacter dokdonensis]KOY51059.1 Flavin containing amine oxidoreductase [Polaribacter dokdonensis DSW-5]SEE19620.1 Flavin containing amine oxidoreductase [Polaribacter dokdonensis DSW-5]
MEKSAYKINIIGAGVSGLIAAQILENYGYHPTIIEATDKVGGRVKSDSYKGYTLDHGFQVLLTSYPAAKKYLDYKALELQEFLPGATIFKNGKQQTIGDPLRKLTLLFPTLFSSIGNFSDKLKVLKLNTILKKKEVSAIFKENEKTTLQYLQDFGFSKEIISDFFKPFFSGIFLEPNLDTSSRMFEFVYKMFGDGLAVLPKKGIQAISDQLKGKLNNTTFLFNTAVKEVKNSSIILQDNSAIKSHITIIATEASSLISNLKNQETEWKSCETLYFESEKRTIQKPIIGLIANENSLVNNIFYHTSVDIANKSDKELLSVTIVNNHQLNENQLIDKVKQELKEYCKIEDLHFLKRYQIKKALPKLTNLQYEISSTETKLKSTIFLAGDQLLNGSLNAAMIAGERAALGVIQTLEDGLIVDELTSEYS